MRSLLSVLGAAACLGSSFTARAEPRVVPPSAACSQNAENPKFLLKFTNVDLNFLVKVLVDSFCKSAVIVDMPKGKVTFQGPDERLTAAQARPLLVKLFVERGFAVEEEATQIRIHRVAP